MTRVKDSYFVIWTIVFVVGCLFAGSLSAQPTAISIIAHPSVNTSQLNASQLRRIFTMRQSTWPDGQPVRVFVMDTRSDLHQQFCKSVLKMFPYQVERTWNKLAYSGLGDKPLTVTNEMQMIEAVKNSPGAIGYVIQPEVEEERVQRIEVATE